MTKLRKIRFMNKNLIYVLKQVNVPFQQFHVNLHQTLTNQFSTCRIVFKSKLTFGHENRMREKIALPTKIKIIWSINHSQL